MYDPAKQQNITMSELSPKRLLIGTAPRLIDEWQLAPKLWDAIRFEADHRGELGQFILTGSAVPADTKEITNSGTGRFTWLTMRPMSLFESGDSTGEVSLKDLKLGGDKLIEEGAKSLLSMKDKIDTDKMNASSFLMALTGTGDFAYRRHDGVCVVPIGCLKS